MQGAIILEYNISMNFRSISVKSLISACLLAGLWFSQATLTRATSAMAPNTFPVAVDDSYTTRKNLFLTISAPGVLQNDISNDPGTLTANLVGGTNRGVLDLNQNGSFTYNPTLNFTGTDVFTYTATDSAGTSNMARVTLTIVNAPPVAISDAFFVNQDTTLVVNAPGVLGNDNDVDGDVITAVLDQSPVHGTFDLNGLKPDGSFVYTPQPGFAGEDTFTYHAYDGSLASDSVTVTITVHDTEPPKITQWLQPQVDINRIYYVVGPIVTLEVTATDNVAVDQVRFSRWDPNYKKYVNIASIQVAPYLWQLDTSSLVLGFNQVYARAYDLSGNDSGQGNFIWLVVETRWLYLPMVIR